MFDKEYSEKRDYIRMFVNAEISFTLNGKSESFSGKSIDLSGKGVAFETSCELKPGDVLDLVLTAEEAKVAPLELKIEVVRVERRQKDLFFIAAETQSAV